MAMNFFRKNEVGTNDQMAELVLGFETTLGEKIAESQRQSEVRMMEFMKQVIKELNDLKTGFLSGPTVEKPKQKEYVAKKVSGLGAEKKANEIMATLYGKMENPHGSKFRAFYTDLERECGLPIYETHKKLTKNLPNKGDGKYPFRKMDTVLSLLDAEYVFEFAKKYKFETK